MAIGVLIKALLLGDGGTVTSGGEPPKDKKVQKNGLEINLKPWHRYQEN